jgi:hypothetical protein
MNSLDESSRCYRYRNVIGCIASAGRTSGREDGHEASPHPPWHLRIPEHSGVRTETMPSARGGTRTPTAVLGPLDPKSSASASSATLAAFAGSTHGHPAEHLWSSRGAPHGNLWMHAHRRQTGFTDPRPIDLLPPAGRLSDEGISFLHSPVRQNVVASHESLSTHPRDRKIAGCISDSPNRARVAEESLPDRDCRVGRKL